MEENWEPDMPVPHARGQFIRRVVIKQDLISTLDDTQSKSTAKPLDEVNIPVLSMP